MSRQIDLSQPLSDEDRAYLKARGRLNEIAMADAMASGEDYSESMLSAGEVLSHDDGNRLSPNTGDVNPIPRDQRNNLGPGYGNDPSIAGQGVDPDETVEVPIGQSGGQVLDYNAFTRDELEEEIDRRNSDRDEEYHISKKGKKADLVAALEDDYSADDEDDESED
jgi:hypothetical protein